ncbi:hypothetical protein ACUUL3_07940 [Thiovibrio sp. JS02]
MITPVKSTGFLAATGNIQATKAEQTQGAGREVAGMGDRITISQAGRTVSALIGKTPNGGSISLADIEARLREDARLVEEKMKGLYSALGINADTEMQLSVDYDGKILVSGAEDKAQALAEAVNADEELANTFRRMSASAGLLEAAKKHQEFAEAYAQNAQQAVGRYGSLFEGGHDAQVNFAFSHGLLDTSATYA